MTKHSKVAQDMRKHHAAAIEHHDHASKSAGGDPMASLYRAVPAALIAIAAAQIGQLAELRRIRRLIAQQHSNATTFFNAIVALIPKDGGSPMPNPVSNPTATQDVQVVIAPTNRSGQPTTGPFAWSTNNAQLTAQPSADGKTCLLVTAAGDIDAIATVTDTVSGNTDTFPVQRSSAPPDNLTTAFNGTATLVDKAAPQA